MHSSNSVSPSQPTTACDPFFCLENPRFQGIFFFFFSQHVKKKKLFQTTCSHRSRRRLAHVLRGLLLDAPLHFLDELAHGGRGRRPHVRAALGRRHGIALSLQTEAARASPRAYPPVSEGRFYRVTVAVGRSESESKKTNMYNTVKYKVHQYTPRTGKNLPHLEHFFFLVVCIIYCTMLSQLQLHSLCWYSLDTLTTNTNT